MNSDGYTLAEALAALIMVGLAIGGLTAGARTLELTQRSTLRSARQSEMFRAAGQDLDRLLAGQGPFTASAASAGRFSGAATGFDFECGADVRCGAELNRDEDGLRLTVAGPAGPARQLRLDGVAKAHFTYIGARTTGDSWPPQGLSAKEALRSVTLAAETPAGDLPLAAVRLWREETRDCSFDLVAQDCRDAAG